MLEYLNENPPVHEILKVVHGIKTKSRRLKWKDISKEDFMEEFKDVPSMFGMNPEPMSDDFRDSIKYAEQLMGQMKSKQVN